ncbi:asparaginase [Heyndrickxia sporothermodurans]|uniref:asparaginase n=1 Tax=Heyndrickxia sporothermodurans TaxID=46224 RepID=UPI000D371ACC|nr:asparaginase [Heyndrickxia sporothermodurans]MBL5768594.1 asparaginase [Heyndrickxia sporothermodurans]MBL5772269.1 asparaginase [Heyndrickxia sporothermodurans]MBL5779364.1 asparaginase [Heyndrickxia sporothermodurans]MBL5782105.1 asparaginase [Heyndrickxia sporothermodurans]MBL5786462.1 asparaginase [Heyndrickxia sporothermodurans]
MEATELVQVFRGDLVESIHKGHIAVVDYKGRLHKYEGDPYRKVFARSSMKPLQAIPVVETGTADHFEFDDADLSLCCASHNAEKQHTERVLSILKRAGLDDHSLKCGTHPLRREDVFKELILEGKEVTPLYNNCSGKHSGMIATAKYMNEPVESYFELSHPVQQRILHTISEMADYPVKDIELGVDGCGVPVHALPLERIAYAYARMTRPERLDEQRGSAVKRITSAMMSAPEMVGGTDRFCTNFMRAVQGKMFGKAGAEAVYCIGDIQTGLGIAIKIEDGFGRATEPVAVEVLRQLNLLTDEELSKLVNHHKPTVLNARKKVVGELVPTFTLKDGKEL